MVILSLDVCIRKEDIHSESLFCHLYVSRVFVCKSDYMHAAKDTKLQKAYKRSFVKSMTDQWMRLGPIIIITTIDVIAFSWPQRTAASSITTGAQQEHSRGANQPKDKM